MNGQGRTLALAVMIACSLALLSSGEAHAGMSATGEPLFHPCTACHPVASAKGGGEASKKLPNGFTGHQIELVGHDVLGKGGDACLVCHDSSDRDPGKLKLVDGSKVDIGGDVAAVCYRCHSDKHAEWSAGIHGNGRPKCTSSGCHDPHTPGSVYAAPLTPFLGTGFQVQVLPVREPFMALAPPAGDPPVRTPWWLQTMAVVGAMTAAVAAGSLALERSR